MDIKDERYLTIKELSGKIKFSQQSIYNMIHKEVFIRGEHYIKPSRKKVLFLWSAVHEWLEAHRESTTESQKSAGNSTAKTQEISSINSNRSIINI